MLDQRILPIGTLPILLFTFLPTGILHLCRVTDRGHWYRYWARNLSGVPGTLPNAARDPQTGPFAGTCNGETGGSSQKSEWFVSEGRSINHAYASHSIKPERCPGSNTNVIRM